MSTIELKNKLHSIIDSISDNEKLKAMLTFLNANDSCNDWWDELTENEKKDIETGIAQADANQFVSSEKVRAQINKLLEDNA